jgi:hypothetical protein
MRPLLAAVAALAAAVAAAPAEGGHEMPIYPSFYPHEIRIETVAPEAAARQLPTGGIHAYVAAEPAFAQAPAAPLAAAVSLGQLVVVSVDPPDCRSLQSALRDIADRPQGIVFHPWPVTPLHPDYLEQADLAAAAGARARAAPATAAATRIERVDAQALAGASDPGFDGWAGPPWLKSGWFAAWRLLAGDLGPVERQHAGEELARLEHGAFADLAERYAAERGLVTRLAGNCRRAVAGYTLRREWYDADDSSGIENIATDSLSGLAGAGFIRTVKLKDFPWNGWLRLGVATAPAAAWNPVAGFGDPAGRLVWAALGDVAAFPVPDGQGWVLDRIADVTPLR